MTDHNRTDEHGRKQGRWTETEFLEESKLLLKLLSAEGDYVDGKRHGHWVLKLADGTVREGQYIKRQRTRPVVSADY